MLEKSTNMSEQEKIILSLIELLKKNSLLDTPSKNTEIQVSYLFFSFNRLINKFNQNDDDDIYARKITEHRYKLIYTMCQPVKVMDYLESNGVIPRSLCSRIYYVSDELIKSNKIFTLKII